MTRTVEASPQTYARIGGVLYLIIIAAGLFAEAFVRDKLIVSSDATATANNILANQSLFRLGVAADLSTFLCAVALAIIFYVLLKPINKTLALLAAFFSLVQDAIGGINDLNQYRALQLLGGADILMAIAGACYLINSFAVILSPPIEGVLFPWVLLPAFIGELSLALWLTVKGVNVPKWEEKASAGRVSGV